MSLTVPQSCAVNWLVYFYNTYQAVGGLCVGNDAVISKVNVC